MFGVVDSSHRQNDVITSNRRQDRNPCGQLTQTSVFIICILWFKSYLFKLAPAAILYLALWQKIDFWEGPGGLNFGRKKSNQSYGIVNFGNNLPCGIANFIMSGFLLCWWATLLSQLLDVHSIHQVHNREERQQSSHHSRYLWIRELAELASVARHLWVMASHLTRKVVEQVWDEISCIFSWNCERCERNYARDHIITQCNQNLSLWCTKFDWLLRSTFLEGKVKKTRSMATT